MSWPSLKVWKAKKTFFFSVNAVNVNRFGLMTDIGINTVYTKALLRFYSDLFRKCRLIYISYSTPSTNHEISEVKDVCINVKKVSCLISILTRAHVFFGSSVTSAHFKLYHTKQRNLSPNLLRLRDWERRARWPRPLSALRLRLLSVLRLLFLWLEPLEELLLERCLRLECSTVTKKKHILWTHNQNIFHYLSVDL